MAHPARLLPALLPALLLIAAPALAADPPARPGPGVAYRSSLAAVLAQRSAVQLTPEQVRQFEQAEARLERDQDAARAEASHAADAPAQGASPPAGKSAPPPSGGPGGLAGAGGMSGGKVRPPPPSMKGSGQSAAAQLQQRLDAFDTEALLQAVESLPEAQRERAIEVASRYREQLFEQRERERSR